LKTGIDSRIDLSEVEGRMKDCRQFYIGGNWTNPALEHELEVINPASEEPIATISLGNATDVDAAVAAANQSFVSYSETDVETRLAYLRRIIDVYQSRMEEMAETISREMGAPMSLARAAQAPAGLRHLIEIVRVLEHFRFEETNGSTLMRKEPIGVCGLITPWNWPMNQIACKVAPALAAGCTMVLKPSEIAPLSAYLFTQILHEAGFPPGVFNLVNGDGPTVGSALASHPDVAMVSFTGSTRAGVSVAVNAAPTVKRVTQELGGKSANILLKDADFEQAVKEGVQACFRNSGQSCDAPTRMLVPRSNLSAATAVARQAAEATKVGDPICRRYRHRSRIQQSPVREGTAPDTEGDRRGSQVGHGRPRPPEWHDEGLLRKAHGIQRCPQRHDNRS
jgi:aldehyde dehydrogenase (NAD+)